MTPAEQAVKAIKAATGLDAAPVTPAHPRRSLDWVKAHVESLALPCPLPPFPETPDAT